MAPKKTKEESLNQLNKYVLLHDNKTSRCHVVTRDQQCEKSISLIEKTNKNNKEPDENASDSSNELIIDESEGKGTDDNNDEESEDENEALTCATISQQHGNTITTTNKSTVSAIQSTSSTPAASALPATTISSDAAVLQQINCNVDVTHKRKKPSGETHNVTNKTKRSTGVSHSDYENLKRENKRLAKEIDMYKNNWMRKSPIVLLRYQISFSPARPPGPTASYFIDVGKFLSEPRSQIILALFGIMHCNALDDKHYPSFFPLFIHYRLHGNPWPANACSSPMNDGSGVVQSLINKQAPASGLDALCTNGSVIELNNVTVVLNETNWEIQIVGAQSS
ncbi:unnamed protein product [Rotaria socialis]|uniref:Uncharacterized protein n=5 Tax=Rotaria socialis TaxID=392032 RepID=A0A818GXY6_9BILA|nr:unnamed protein product [Rotaria socialis]